MVNKFHLTKCCWINRKLQIEKVLIKNTDNIRISWAAHASVFFFNMFLYVSF